MTFSKHWNGLSYSVIRNLQLPPPPQTPIPTPEEIAGAFEETGMDAGEEEYLRRANAAMDLHEEVGEFSLQLILIVLGTAAQSLWEQLKDWKTTDPPTGPAKSALHKMLSIFKSEVDRLEDLISGKDTASEDERQRLILLSMKIFFVYWESIPDQHKMDAGLKNPLAPLIKAYLTRPVPAGKNDRPTGIITKGHYRIHQLQTLADADPTEIGIGQVMLPSLEALLPEYDEMAIFPILSHFDALQGSDKEAGIGLRTLVTVLTEIDLQNSFPIGESGVLVAMTPRAIAKHLWPRARYHKGRLQKINEALYAWNHAGVPDSGGLRRVIGTVGEWIVLPPDFPPDKEIFFQVYLPPGANHGALVHRETQDFLGANHGPMYRALLTLSHQWSRASHSKKDKSGKKTVGTAWPYATRPVRLRREDDLPLIRKGREVPGDPKGPREPNPMIKFLPSYNDERVLRLFHAPAKITTQITTKNRSVYLKRAWDNVTMMEELGLLEKGTHAGNLKLCPPLGWGANFQTPEAVKLIGTRRRTH